MPGKFKIRYRKINFDASKYQSNVQDASKIVLRLATRAWLRAVIESVPVWSGTSRGTLKPLGRLLRVAVPIGQIHQRGFHTVRGRRYTLGPESGEKESDFELKDSGLRFEFIFYQTLPWFIWNSFGTPVPEVQSAPWMSFEKGSKAFFATMTEELNKRIPPIYQKALQFRTINA